MKTCNVVLLHGLWKERHELIIKNKKGRDTFVILEHEGNIHMEDNISDVGYDIVLSGLSEQSVERFLEIESDQKLPSKYNYSTWPFAMVHSTLCSYLDSLENKMKKIDANKKSEYNTLYLNHTSRPREHRIMLLNSLFTNKLFDYGINTFRNFENEIDYKNELSFETYPWYKYINNYDRWTPHTSHFTYEYLFHSSALELVTETITDYIRITEKTLKPIILKRPFLILGGKNIHKFLQSKGFHLFEEIFDYSFDSKDNLEDRIYGIVKNLAILKKIKPHKIVKKVEDKLRDNYQILEDIGKNASTFPSKLLNKICKYDKMIIYQPLYEDTFGVRESRYMKNCVGYPNGLRYNGLNPLIELIKRKNPQLEITYKFLK